MMSFTTQLRAVSDDEKFFFFGSGGLAQIGSGFENKHESAVVGGDIPGGVIDEG